MDAAAALSIERSRGSTIEDMVFVPGGVFCVGSNRYYPEEAPVHRAAVDGFWIDLRRATRSRSTRR